MKSATVIRNTLLSSQVLSPMIGSSAFVVGMRSRSGPPAAVALRASNEDAYEFDFIAAATQAAVEREAREEQAIATSTTLSPSVSSTRPPLQTTTTPFGTSLVPDETTSVSSFEREDDDDDDFEFDFIAAATQAAVEREA
eukprot:CAMPEP_0197177736 /NCGR_PEP_ID=MMETSP1423-20130617/3240_1 /TAXON_ID=476441 /ORGANISM="Pseudo-nitzschia heimii, Strain UNC1101" /LENGTH=139 /DNA_ID=CAMNT_0042627335 /DNA_START=58 /DNA_END=473 /DNA_ORIENTATION=-